jgi:type I restriction enzyme S subunit
MKKKLTDLCDIQYGYAFDSKLFTNDEGYIPLIRIRDVQRGFSETYYSGKYPVEYVVHPGDLLVGMDGEFNISRWKDRDALLNQRVCKITAKNGTSEEYIRFALSKALKEIEQRTSFVTVKHLSAKELNRLVLDIPCYSSQVHIVGLCSSLERIIEKRKKQLQILDELIKARFVEMFGDPEINTKGYQKEPLQKHADVLVGYPFKSEGYTEGGVRIVGGYNLMQGFIIWEDCKYWPDTDGFEQYLLKDGDIVMAMDRPWVNGGFKIASVDKEHLPALLIQRTACIRGKDVEQEFLYSLLNSHWFADHCNITGSLVPHISNKDINSYEIVLPPIEEQKAYAEFVRQVDKSKSVA